MSYGWVLKTENERFFRASKPIEKFSVGYLIVTQELRMISEQQVVTKSVQQQQHEEDGGTTRTRIYSYAKAPPKYSAAALDYGWSRCSSHRSTQRGSIVPDGGRDNGKHDGGVSLKIVFSSSLSVFLVHQQTHLSPRDRLPSRVCRSRSCKGS